MEKRTKYIVSIIAFVGAIILLSILNPFSWNDATERTVVTQAGGNQFVEFKPGVFYSGFFSKEQAWPNQISVSHIDTLFDGDLSLRDNTIEIGIIKDVRFNDATVATVSGITQYILPVDESQMIAIHNAHKTPESFVQRRLSPYTIECLKSAAQLMSSEMHYSGGRAQMTQDYMDQLKNGSYLLNIKETNIFDSVDNERKRVYRVQIQTDVEGKPKRKFSSIKEYSVQVGDAQIIDVDYEPQVDNMLSKKISAATAASISKQELMTAQQQSLTAKAKGEKELVDIEYEQRKIQTREVVEAQTKVEVAKQDLIQQDIAYQAAVKEGMKIKTLADANAYEKRTAFTANGALEQKLAAWVEERKAAWSAFASFQGNIVPMYQVGNQGGSSNAAEWMQIMGMKAAKDITLDLSNKK
jgi:hypothetical protein